MPHEITDYLIGERGVQLVPSPIHTPDGGILVAQNVEFVRDQGIGGIGTRAGLAKLTGQTVLGGSILQLANVPLAYPGEFDLMVGLNAGETNTWDKSTDGTTYTGLASATLGRPTGIDKSPTGLGGGAISSGQRCASYKGLFYYPSDNYVVDTTAPPLNVFNGTLSYEQFSVPANPTSTGVCKWISDLLIYNGLIYLAVYDPSGVAPDHKGRVLAYDPSVGTLYEVGNRFGNGSGENTGGFPFCLAAYGGYLWAGTYGISGNNLGKVYKIRVGVDETWTLDTTGTLHNGYYMSLCGYKGNLYMATDADSSGTAIIQKRTSTGTVTTSLSAPASNVSYFTGLIEFNGNLYAAHYKSASSTCLIKKFDNTTWTTDLDVTATYASKTPGLPFIFRSNLYWPFLGSETGASNLTGFLLKLTTGGVWSRVLNGVGIRGCLGQYTFTS